MTAQSWVRGRHALALTLFGLTLMLAPPFAGDAQAAKVTIEDKIVGEGPAAKVGDKVAVHYVGWLTNGRRFDTSRDAGIPLRFILGYGAVISGWHQGIHGMRVGGVRRLVIPPELAYGPDPPPGSSIPPNATLIFEVELVGIEAASAGS